MLEPVEVEPLRSKLFTKEPLAFLYSVYSISFQVRAVIITAPLVWLAGV